MKREAGQIRYTGEPYDSCRAEAEWAQEVRNVKNSKFSAYVFEDLGRLRGGSIDRAGPTDIDSSFTRS
jgi:hypothetical protein